MMHISELSPQEVLGLAISTEKQNEVKYAEWADRFRPFDSEMADLLSELSYEEVLHARLLTEKYHEVFGYCRACIQPEEVFEKIEPLGLEEERFFVTNEAAALRILWAALKTELHARQFYQSLARDATDLALKETYAHLLNFEEDHVRVIKDKLRFYSGLDMDISLHASG